MNIMTWIVSVEGAMKYCRFESPAREFFTDWWAALQIEWDKRQNRVWARRRVS